MTIDYDPTHATGARRGSAGIVHRTRWYQAASTRRVRSELSRPWTIEQYRCLLGWRVEVQDGRATLSLGAGIAAVAVKSTVAPDIMAALRRYDGSGPVLAVNGQPPCWLFFADPNGMIVARDDLPGDVALLECPRQIPIPTGDVPCDQSRWIVPPDTRRRWLPTVATILSAVTVSVRLALR